MAFEPPGSGIASLLSQKLPAPTLFLSATIAGVTLSWTKIEGASGYVLERCKHPFFMNADVIYTGEQTSHDDIRLFMTHTCYRVKALGGQFSSDSDWSNVVQKSR